MCKNKFIANNANKWCQVIKPNQIVTLIQNPIQAQKIVVTLCYVLRSACSKGLNASRQLAFPVQFLATFGYLPIHTQHFHSS